MGSYNSCRIRLKIRQKHCIDDVGASPVGFPSKHNICNGNPMNSETIKNSMKTGEGQRKIQRISDENPAKIIALTNVKITVKFERQKPQKTVNQLKNNNLTWWYFKNSSWTPAISLITIWTLNKYYN